MRSKKTATSHNCTLTPTTRPSRCERIDSCEYRSDCLLITGIEDWKGFKADCVGYKEKEKRSILLVAGLRSVSKNSGAAIQQLQQGLKENQLFQ